MLSKNKKQKIQIKIFLSLFVLAVLFFGLTPSFVYARIVPCGPGTAKPECELCDIFVLFDNIVKFFLQILIPPIAALMLAIGGSMFFGAAGDPGKINQAKSLFTSVAIGLLIVYGAYLLISLFFLAIGVNQWTGLQNWFVYPC